MSNNANTSSLPNNASDYEKVKWLQEQRAAQGLPYMNEFEVAKILLTARRQFYSSLIDSVNQMQL